MMTLFRRRKPEPAPLLSEAEMAKLHEEIFEEPITAERIYTMYYAMPAKYRQHSEWVMDQHTWNRCRRAFMPDSISFMTFAYTEATANALFPNDTLLGRPIVIEPFAKLELRVRT